MSGLNIKVPSLQEVEALRDVRDAAWQKLGQAQAVLNDAAKSCRSAEAEYRSADDTYCAARRASGTTQQPR